MKEKTHQAGLKQGIGLYLSHKKGITSRSISTGEQGRKKSGHMNSGYGDRERLM
jgi:hypothetical protein